MSVVWLARILRIRRVVSRLVRHTPAISARISHFGAVKTLPRAERQRETHQLIQRHSHRHRHVLVPINEQLQFKLDRSVGNLERCFYATASLSLRVAVAVAVGVVVFWTNVDFFVVIFCCIRVEWPVGQRADSTGRPQPCPPRQRHVRAKACMDRLTVCCCCCCCCCRLTMHFIRQ